MRKQARGHRAERGQALTESAALIGLIAVAAVLSVVMIGDGLQGFLMPISKVLMPIGKVLGTLPPAH